MANYPHGSVTFENDTVRIYTRDGYLRFNIHGDVFFHERGVDPSGMEMTPYEPVLFDCVTLFNAIKEAVNAK